MPSVKYWSAATALHEPRRSDRNAARGAKFGSEIHKQAPILAASLESISPTTSCPFLEEPKSREKNSVIGTMETNRLLCLGLEKSGVVAGGVGDPGLRHGHRRRRRRRRAVVLHKVKKQ